MLKKYVFVDIAYFGVNMQLRCLAFCMKKKSYFLVTDFKQLHKLVLQKGFFSFIRFKKYYFKLYVFFPLTFKCILT